MSCIIIENSSKSTPTLSITVTIMQMSVNHVKIKKKVDSCYVERRVSADALS